MAGSEFGQVQLVLCPTGISGGKDNEGDQE
jgi:hypothetical protein